MAATPLSPLVGRERELAILRDQLAAASGGHGSLVLLSGEAGIGKTTLAETVCREASAQGALVLIGRCYDLTETPPYGPWMELFVRYRQADALPPLPVAFSVRGTVGAVPSQAVLFRQVLDFLAALTAQRPAVLFLDDLHWSDPASLDLLRFLAQSIATLPLMMVVTYRSDDLSRYHPLYQLLPLLVREAAAERLELHRLPQSALRTLVETRYTLAEQDALRLVSYLHERAAGNALFITELLRTLEEQDALFLDAEGWRIGDLHRITVPTFLRQVIDGRVRRLGEAAQQLLTVAAVIGQDVSLDVWMKVSEIDEETLLTLVERSVGAGLLEAMTDGTTVRFAHALIREALYEGILPPRRRHWHERVGETLADRPYPDPDAIADHFQRAGDARAVEWLIAAGERAKRSYAWLTAAARYETALAMMERAGTQTAERGWLLFRLACLRAFFDPAQNVRYLEEALRLGEQTGDRALAAIARYQRGNAQVHSRQDTEGGMVEKAAGAAAVEALSPTEYARLARELRELSVGFLDSQFFRWELIPTLAFMGRFREALAIGEDGSTLEPPMTSGQGYWGLAMTYAMLGRPAEASDAFARARPFFHAIGHHHQTGWIAYYELLLVRLAYYPEQVTERQRLADAGEEAWRLASDVQADVSPRWPRLPLLLVEGDWVEARDLAEVAREYRFAAHREVAIGVLGQLACWQGESDLAWKQVRAMFPDGPETAPGRMTFYDAMVLQRVAAALSLEAGDIAIARAWLEAHSRYLNWSGTVLGRADGSLGWGAYYRALGVRERAAAAATQALADATDPRQPLALLAAHRLLGELATAAGQFADAAPHLEAALALADACAAPYERALTLLAQAELRGLTGYQEAARTLLDEVRAICVPLAAQPTLAKADALTLRLDAIMDPPPAYPAGLSAREVEVLRLVAAGRTNREIAELFFLSLPTINNHVAHILAKTNTANRAEASAFAQRHGLV